ncbi:C2 calcium-dependent domain-containing protein 4C-like [Callorhinchus milii]|nr:C2 calcium-dependent domain-containing protein 4C-like [Callorhinchus milii]|eukprot:gi/632973374/ref/XP_007903123.1/ PREDICTED: C2 calcium-dependent domain-containing protein 4C-like [Callorhinchus milii]
MWLFDKVRASGENSISSDSKMFASYDGSVPRVKISRLYSNVLTPDKIPDFFIPPKLPVAQRNSSRGSCNQFNKCKLKLSASCNDIPSFSRKCDSNKNFAHLANCHIIQVESAEDLSSDNNQSSDKDRIRDYKSLMPCYGFSPLLENPHTRRKESLFHVDPVTSSIQQTLQQKEYITDDDQRQSTTNTFLQIKHLSLPELTLPLSKSSRMFSSQGTFDSDTQSSSESSPFNSPSLHRSVSGSSLLKLFSNESSTQVLHSKSKQTLGRNSSFSTDECSSTDTSPSISRKSVYSCQTSLHGCPFAHSAIFPLDLLQCRERLFNEHTILLNKRGTVRLSTEFDFSRVTFRVRVIAVEELYDKDFEIKNVNCYVLLYLMPGKFQKQCSTIIKNSSNPIFNEDFFFDGITEENYKNMYFKIKVINKGVNLKRNTQLGEKELPLSSLLPNHL